MAGEMILGGKQNRIVRQDVIVPPGARDLEVPVYCGQQGRWTVISPTFESKASVANQAVRKEILDRADQSAIWQGIHENMRKNDVPESTGALQSVFDDKAVQKRIANWTRECAPPRGRATTGVVVTRGGRVVGADLFGDPRLYRALEEKILRAYAVEVYDPKPAPADEKTEREEVRRFLAALGDARMTSLPTPGWGRAFEVETGSARGGALVLNVEPVHVAVMP